jgi:cytochrome P450
MANASPSEVDFFDPATNDCPYGAYEFLREHAPVYQDPVTGMFVISRYEDIRAIVLDNERFSNALGNKEEAVAPEDPEKARALLEAAEADAEIRQMYLDRGWVPARSLNRRDEPDHMQLRRLFNQAFRPEKVAELDPFVEALAYRLLDAVLDDGHCEWVAAFAVPLPLYTIGEQMGVPEEDMPRIKGWTDAWVRRLGLAQTAAERKWSAAQEIEGQQYFQSRFDQLREQPDDTLLSELVNTEIPEWGRPLSNEELHAEMFADLFVGGAETTTNALSAGVRMLIEHPDVWDRLKSDPGRYVDPFIEELLRLEAPVQGLLRTTTVDVDLHGVRIPQGAVLNIRYAAGNRDQRRFTCPAEIDLDRRQPRTHLAFGVGPHHCLGAPLARRELHFGFSALVDRVDSLRFADGRNDFRIAPNYFLRSLERLHIEFTPALARTAGRRRSGTSHQ